MLLSKEEESFNFDLSQDPLVLSLNLGFAAPVNVNFPYNQEDLAFLMKFDQDPYNRFQASQNLAMTEILSSQPLSEHYLNAYKYWISEDMDPALKAYGLCPPSLQEIVQHQAHKGSVNFEESEKLRRSFQEKVVQCFYKDLLSLYENNQSSKPYSPSPADQGQRLLKNTALSLLAYSPEQKEKIIALMTSQFDQADNMTDQMTALKSLLHFQHSERDRVIQSFYSRWAKDSTVYSKWLRAVASAPNPGNLDSLKELMNDDIFDLTVPNHVRSIIGGLVGNPLLFHKEDGSGYQFVKGFIKEYDSINPQVCARMAAHLFSQYPIMDQDHKALLGDALKELKGWKDLSENTYEIISKTLDT